MPREARNVYKGNLYHVMTQGINKEKIFCNDIYKKVYIKLMFDNTTKQNVKIVAYCIMSNHAHLLLNVKEVKDMSEFMKIINMKFAMIYNEMEKRVGVVFRNRFESEVVLDDKYFYNCVNYIHNNPVKAGIVRQAKDYKFSSANNYSLANALNELRYRYYNLEDELIDFLDVDKDQTIDDRMEIIIKEFCTYYHMKGIKIEDKKMMKSLVRMLKEKTKANNTKIAKRLRNI